MNILPSKTIPGVYTIAIILLVLVSVMFLNKYFGPNKEPLLGFLAKKQAPTTPGS